MNVYLNYLLEASIGLCLFLLVYKLLLNKETNFTAGRIFLLTGIVASVVFPLIKISTQNSPVPSMNLSIQAYEPSQIALPEIETESLPEPTLTLWQILLIIYFIGLGISLLVFLFRLINIIRVLKQSAHYKFLGLTIVEVKGRHTPFSFFKYIFISDTPPLPENDKQQIVEHESFHARLYHSFDIVLINLVGIVFWFHPLIRSYKKILVQLHEFEADARAVETHDVDEYCSLLARTALHSADFKLANHFSNSLTIKRINMMRTFKQKTKRWKLVIAGTFLPILFFIVSCQDQVEDPSVATDKMEALPEQVQQSPTLQPMLDGEPIFMSVEVMPTPSVGLDNYVATLRKQVIYPDAARSKGLRGKAFVKFVVKKDGTLTNFEIVKGISEELDREALRILKDANIAWKPGMQNGKVVHTQFVIPVQFGE